MNLSNNEKKKIREINYEIHCHEITISQPHLQNGHLLKGYGKIKQLPSGELTLEFICLECQHRPNPSGSIPDDFAIKEQTVYLEAKSIDLKSIRSKNLYFKTNLLHAINQGPNLYKIPLKYIEFEHQPHAKDKAYSYLTIEFHGEPDIPPNKQNTIQHSDGSGSVSWNETVINFGGAEYSIKEKENFTTAVVKYPHDAHVDNIKASLLFYICISTGRLIQPYVIEISTADKCKTCIYSIDKKILYAKMPRSIGAWTTGSDGKRITDKHYELLKNILLISLIQPKTTNSINEQWIRIWHGFHSDSLDITMLTLSVSIEGILNDIYIPHIKKSLRSNRLEREKEHLINTLKNIEGIDASHLQSITTSIQKWGNMYPAKALSHLHSQGIITSKQKKDWHDLRNSSAHPRLSQQSEADSLKKRRRINSCFGLFYRLLFNILEYQGPQYSFDDKEHSETYPYIRALPDFKLSDHYRSMYSHYK